MTESAAKLLNEFLKLSDADRDEFVAAVNAIHEGPEPSSEEQAAIDAAWREEIRSRARRVLDGEPGIPWEQAKARILANLRAK